MSHNRNSFASPEVSSVDATLCPARLDHASNSVFMSQKVSGNLHQPEHSNDLCDCAEDKQHPRRHEFLCLRDANCEDDV